MNNEKRDRIDNLLKLYNKKSLIETALLNNELDILKDRSKLDEEFDNTRFEGMSYAIESSNDDDAKAMYNMVYFHIYNHKDVRVDRGQHPRININNIIKAFKDSMLHVKEENSYLSLALSYTNDNYTLGLEVSTNYNYDGKFNNFLIIRLIVKYEKEIIELINYNTNINHYGITYGDETAIVDLFKDEVVVDVD